MKALADLLPPLLWALSIASHVYLYLEHSTSKGKVVSEAISTEDALANQQAAYIASQQANAAAQQGVTQNGSQLAAPVATIHPIVQAVVTGVQASTPPSNWATTAANVLQGLMPIIQPAEQIGRASVRTQGEVAIGVAALSVLLQAFFPHPNA